MVSSQFAGEAFLVSQIFPFGEGEEDDRESGQHVPPSPHVHQLISFRLTWTRAAQWCSALLVPGGFGLLLQPVGHRI